MEYLSLCIIPSSSSSDVMLGPRKSPIHVPSKQHRKSCLWQPVPPSKQHQKLALMSFIFHVNDTGFGPDVECTAQFEEAEARLAHTGTHFCQLKYQYGHENELRLMEM